MVVSNSTLFPSSLGVRRTGHDQVNFREKNCHCDQPDQHGYAVNLAHYHSVEKLYTVIYNWDSLSSSTKQQEERWGGGGVCERSAIFFGPHPVPSQVVYAGVQCFRDSFHALDGRKFLLDFIFSRVSPCTIFFSSFCCARIFLEIAQPPLSPATNNDPSLIIGRSC